MHNCAVVYVAQHTETPDIFLRMAMKIHRWAEIKYHTMGSSFSNSQNSIVQMGSGFVWNVKIA